MLFELETAFFEIIGAPIVFVTREWWEEVNPSSFSCSFFRPKAAAAIHVIVEVPVVATLPKCDYHAVTKRIPKEFLENF